MIKQSAPNFCDLNMSNFIIQRGTKELYFVDLQSFDLHIFDHPIMTFVKYLHLNKMAGKKIEYEGDENRFPDNRHSHWYLNELIDVLKNDNKS